MIRFDDHRPPLWMERADVYWGTHDTDFERDLEELEDRPSLSLTPPRAATGLRVPCEGTPALDRSVGASDQAPGGDSPCPAPGPNSEELS